MLSANYLALDVILGTGMLLPLINPPGFAIHAHYPVTTFDAWVFCSGCDNCGDHRIKAECYDRQDHLNQTKLFDFAHSIFTTVWALELAYVYFVHIKSTAPVNLSSNH
jgi:hypothetical protein